MNLYGSSTDYIAADRSTTTYSYPDGIPVPSPEQTIIPTPVDATAAAAATPAPSTGSSSSSQESSLATSATSTKGPRPSARGFRRSTGEKLSTGVPVPRKSWTQTRKLSAADIKNRLLRARRSLSWRQDDRL
ncbi:hypothetical protein NUW54_g9215 [Trametes sanguinea]|uniref:Uncharacterized protein n=1 Tax=Trametes sanguinea TaxID=158606 RepID=A0ACC1PA10_9APHY|nr:hypothetical protein NUW54_g9215 [Trametes sanguinea]